MGKNKKRSLLLFLITYSLLLWGFFTIAAEDWQQIEKKITAVVPETPLRLVAGDELTQTIVGEMDQIRTISLFLAAETPDAQVHLSIEENEQILWEKKVSAETITNYTDSYFAIDPPLSEADGKQYMLRINCSAGVMVCYAGSSMSAGKYNVNIELGDTLKLNQSSITGQLVMNTEGVDFLTAYQYIIPVGVILGVVLFGAIVWMTSAKGQNSKIGCSIRAFKQYGFLLKQLVMRDFKVKYKASALGVIWSFLNPLLTMLVYYFVFSTIFQNNIENFPAYLITGIIVFNYFSEATSLGMGSIVGNGGLITKVYIPKYIFPLSKVLSSAINLCISMIPMMVIILLVGIPLQKSMLLLPVAMMFLMIFSFGISLILATMNTFFRDTQFLWSVLITMWNFLTPIFYPESIIPSQYLSIYQMNPMYQMVGFVRSIMINGVSPSPTAYVYCMVASAVSLMVGLYVFRKKQNEFVLHL